MSNHTSQPDLLQNIKVDNHRAQILETVYQITAPVRALRPLDETLAEIDRQIRDVFQPDTYFLALVKPGLEQIVFPYALVENKTVYRAPVPLHDDASLAAWVVANKVPFATDEDPEKYQYPVSGLSPFNQMPSVMCVPLVTEDLAVGAICVQREEPGAYSPADLETLTAVAEHLAVIMQNATLFTTTREMLEQGTTDYQTAVALRQAIADIGTSLEKETVTQNFLYALHRVVSYENATVFLWQQGKLNYAAGHNVTDRPSPLAPQAMESFWQEHPLMRVLQETQTAVYVADTRKDERWQPFSGGEFICSWLAAPLLVKDELIGVLLVDSRQPDAFDRRVEWLVTTLAGHTAVAIRNALLYENSEQQLAELATLYQASATMTANLDQDFVLQTVVSEMVRALQVDSCTIFVWDKDQQTLIPAAHQSHAYWQQEIAAKAGTKPLGLRRLEHLEQHAMVHRIFNTRKIESLRVDQTQTPEEQELLVAAGLKSVMLVPLVRQEEVLGILALGEILEPRSYGRRELRLAQNLAGQAAVAIEHAHLFSQAQRRIEELSTFHDIVLQLNTPLQLKNVLDEITRAALKLLPATNSHIFLYDEATEQFTFGSALWQDGRREPAVKSLRPSGKGITATIVKQAKPVVINDAPNHPFYQSKKARQWHISAIAGFPLRYGEQVIGAFTIAFKQPHTFSRDELLLLNLLAEQAAVAVRNAELFADSQRRLQDMSALVDMAKQVTGNLKLQDVLQTTVQILRGLMKARASTITMLSDRGDELVVKAAVGVDAAYMNARMKLEDTVSGQVVRSSDLIYIRDTHSDPAFLFFDKRVRSLLVVPLIVRDEAIGTLTIDSDQPNAFSESDMQLMTIAAAQVAVALQNARLFEKLEARAEELALAYEEIKESDRLKDELVQNVSHELRTPLTFVKGYVDLLMDGGLGLLTAEQQEYLQIVSDKTDEITRIIEDIITLQRIDAGNLMLEPVAMAELLQTAVINHRLVANDRGLSIVADIPAGTAGMVMIDKSRMNQVLDNLIGNAMKFSPDGGVVTIAMKEQEDRVSVIISDEGIGMPKEKYKRIFERFYQIDGSTRRRFGGTGIGLAIVKRIIDAHNGEIWVESKVDEGSSFTFVLPKLKSEVLVPSV